MPYRPAVGSVVVIDGVEREVTAVEGSTVTVKLESGVETYEVELEAQ